MGNQWGISGGLTYGQDQNQKGNITPTFGVKFVPGSNNQMGGEPELPQAKWGLFNTLARGFAANPAFGRRMSYSGPQTMAGQTYYGAPGTLVKQEGRRNPFRTKWTNTYAVPGAPKLYGVGPDGAPTKRWSRY